MARLVTLLVVARFTWTEGSGVCSNFPCPAGSKPKKDSGGIGRTAEECCQRLCSTFKCPLQLGFVPVDNASVKTGLTTSSCCTNVPPCVANSRYVPLSMPGVGAGATSSSIECSKRCQQTVGCIGFSWLADSSCHLAGANATLRSMPGGVSGNETCHSPRQHLRMEGEVKKVHEFCQRQSGKCVGKTYQLFSQERPKILPSRPDPAAKDALELLELDLAGVAVADWDHDGLLDVVTSHGSGRLGLFLRDSDGKLQASTDNPFRSVGVFGESAKPTVFDWDGDGRLDILVGNADGDLKFLKGSGDGDVAMTWNWYPFSTLKPLDHTAPALADLTDDGYPDLVLGHGCQLDVYLGQGNHSLVLAASYEDFLPDARGSCAVVPTVWDWDGDGIKEVIVGDHAGKFHLCRLMNRTKLACEVFDGYGAGKMASPSACDWDSDGVPDLIVQSSGFQDLTWFRRSSSNGSNELLESMEVPDAPALYAFDVGESAVPVLVDWDLDGDLDLIVGSADGRLWYFPQEGGKFVSFNQPDGPFATVDVGTYCAPAAVDWDSDGFPDLVLGTGEGKLFLLRGGASKPELLEGEQNPFTSVDLKMRVHPTVVDWDHDGDLDLLLLVGGRIQYFKNESGSLKQVPEELGGFNQVGDVLRRQGLSTEDSLCLQAVDVDSDGDWDLVVGGLLLEQLSDGSLKYVTGSASPFPSQPLEGRVGPPCLAVGDLDMDGIPDLAMGFRDGKLGLGFRRAGGDILGAAQEGPSNPVGDLGLGVGPKIPSVVDLNRDGKPDLLVSLPDRMRLFLQQPDRSLKEVSTAEYLSLENGASSTLAMATADWTGDGDDDILLVQEHGLLLLERNGTVFLPPSELLTWSPGDAGPVGVAAADWDADGRLDVIIGLATGKLLYWHQDASGQLQLVPEDRSPFAEIRGEGSAQPAVVDADGDGKFDLLLGMASGRLRLYLQDDAGQLQPRHTLGGFSGNVVPVPVDWDGDGTMEVILGTASGTLAYLEKGRCALSDACFKSGICNSRSQVCECLQGHAGLDCSKCAVGYSSTLRNSEQGHDCFPCPGVHEHTGACHNRGLCVDDSYVQMATENPEISDPRLLRGNGSCLCNPNFLGQDCGLGECPAGHEPVVALGSRSISCRICQQGFGKEHSGNQACGACHPGTAARSGSCQPCGPGRYQPRFGQSECILCSSGSQTDHGRTACSLCPAGTIGLSGECQICPSFTTAGSSRTQCVIDWALVMAAVVFTLLTLVFFQLLVHVAGVRRNIADIAWSAVDEAVVITMQSRHHFGPRLLKVRLHDTGVAWLDRLDPSKTHFFVRTLSPTQLQLYTDPKIPASTPTEASSGTLKPLFMSEAFGTRFLRLPVLAWLAMAVLGIVLLSSLAPIPSIPWWYLLLTAVLDVASILALQVRSVRLDSLTPLQTLLRQYLQHLHGTNPCPSACEPGALRAVSATQILHFHEFFRSLIQQRNMHYVCPSILKPVTKKWQLSFAEVAGSGMVDWFISHFWTLPFKDFAQSLRAHAMYVDGNWGAIRYWICAFSHNQWQLDKELPCGALRESSFYKALMAPSCQGTGMMMDRELTPLKRSWCLFEMLQTFKLHERGLSQHRLAPFMGLFLLSPGGVLNVGRGSVDLAVRIGRQLDNLHLEDASATAAEDKQRIDDDIRSTPGGFAAVNCKLRAEIRLVLEQMSSRFADDLNELNAQLYEGDSQEVEIHVAPDAPSRGDNTYCSWTG